MNFGGSLNSLSCYLLERSLKTLALRVDKQNRNTVEIATYLQEHSGIRSVHYPGLSSHAGYEIAKSQMNGFGGMLSFELKNKDAVVFQKKLKLIRPSMSLGYAMKRAFINN